MKSVAKFQQINRSNLLIYSRNRLIGIVLTLFKNDDRPTRIV